MKTPIRTRLILAIIIDRVTECWNWTAAKNDQGYGHIWHDGKLRSAHRVSYECFNGPIGDELTVDHLCRNVGCINPDHLELTSMRENILRSDGPAAMQARQKYCKRGHPLSGANLYVEPGGRRKCRACQRLRTK